MANTSTHSRFKKTQDFLRRFYLPPKLVFIIVGVISTIWFLIRVIPKPQRATYPCMKAAAPWASAFIIYLVGITGSSFFFKKSVAAFKDRKFAWTLVFIPALLMFLTLSLVKTPNLTEAKTLTPEMVALSHPAGPIGVAKGTNPGRVTWIHNPDATNADMINSDDDYWYEDHNADQDIIEDMLADGLNSLTGKNSPTDSWDALFKYFNNNHGKGDVGYTSGEKVYIKVNFTNSCCGQLHRMDATPQLMYVLLKSLIEDAGIAQSNITIGDPFRDFKDSHIAKLHPDFPNVHYIGPNEGGGIELTVATSSDILKFSDGVNTAHIPQAAVDADYFINMPCLKSHDVGGITIAAKNHQGSILAPGDNVAGQSAFYMHYSLPGENSGMGKYRHLVDYMSHEHLGGKNLLVLVDGIWGGDNWEGNIFKWQMSPFNDDYPSSLLLSQDPVAIEAVCYDLLLEEYTTPPLGSDYPYIDGTNDYLYQAASSDYWPSGIEYDPEGDGSVIGSLGVYEHWNNATDRKYSRNLGTGTGIELLELYTKETLMPNQITAENSELPSNEVNVIYVDSASTVWIGTNAGLSRLAADGWKHYDTILFNENVNDIAYELTSYGKELWIATDSGLTVSSYNDLDGISGATTYVSENSPIVGNKVSAVDVDVNHNRWIGTELALNVFKGSSWDSAKTWKDDSDNDFLFSENPITDIEPYLVDTLTLISTKGKGIVRSDYDMIDGFTGASTYGTDWTKLASGNVNSIAVDEELQWYGTDNGANKHTSNLTKNDWYTYDEAFGIISNQVNATYIDQNENAWLGTPQGISIVLPDGGVYKLSSTEGLINNNINHISGDISGKIWVATSGGIQWFEDLSGVQVILGKPVLTAPDDYALDVNTTVDIIWQEVSGATSYSVEVATDNDFTNIIESDNSYSSTSYSLSGLNVLSTYFWRIAANSAALTSEWSDTYRFTTNDISSSSTSIAESGSFSIFPNPASDKININLQLNSNQNVQIKIYSLNGELIAMPVNHLYVDGAAGNIEYDISNRALFPKGMYIVNIVGETFNHVKKISIQ